MGEARTQHRHGQHQLPQRHYGPRRDQHGPQTADPRVAEHVEPVANVEEISTNSKLLNMQFLYQQ